VVQKFAETGPDGLRPMPLTLFIQSWIRLRVLASFAFENGWF
jgi:hypothetical protein